MLICKCGQWYDNELMVMVMISDAVEKGDVSMFQKSFILMCIDELNSAAVSSCFVVVFSRRSRLSLFSPSLTAGSVLLTSIVPESCSLLAAVQKTIWWIWQLAAFALLENERATDKRRNDEGSFCLVWSWSSDTLIRVCNTVALSEDRTSLAQVLQQTHFTKTAPPMTDSLL